MFFIEQKIVHSITKYHIQMSKLNFKMSKCRIETLKTARLPKSKNIVIKNH